MLFYTEVARPWLRLPDSLARVLQRALVLQAIAALAALEAGGLSSDNGVIALAKKTFCMLES